MSCRNTILPLAALLACPLLLSIPASADQPVPAVASHPPLPVPTGWSVPPEAVRSAAVTLHDACVAWPWQVPLAPEPNSPPLARDKPTEAMLCQAVLDPTEHRMFLMLQGGLVAMLGVGAAVGADATVATRRRLLGIALARAAFYVWDRLPHRQRDWSE